MSKSSEKDHTRFKALQIWVGYVLECGEKTFIARIEDATGDELDHEAEILLDELHAPDRKMVAPGVYLRWVIGYRDTPNARERVSVITLG